MQSLRDEIRIHRKAVRRVYKMLVRMQCPGTVHGDPKLRTAFALLKIAARSQYQKLRKEYYFGNGIFYKPLTDYHVRLLHSVGMPVQPFERWAHIPLRETPWFMWID